MILLDTNVLSALLERTPDLVAVRWFDERPAESIWTTSITGCEIQAGIEFLERGRRRKRLEQISSALLKEDFNRRHYRGDPPARWPDGGDPRCADRRDCHCPTGHTCHT